MLFVILFMPPLFFLIRKKPLGFIVNLILCIGAILTLGLFGIGIIVYFLAVMHAVWHYRKDENTKQAELLAEKIAEKTRASGG